MLNKLLFGSIHKKYTKDERMVRGIKEVLYTQGSLLVLFILLFKTFLSPESEV